MKRSLSLEFPDENGMKIFIPDIRYFVKGDTT